MIPKLIPFGWFATALLVVAGLTGYRVESGSDALSGHMLPALIATSCLLIVYGCLGIYMLGSRWLVRRRVREVGASWEWVVRYDAVSGRSLMAAAIGAVPVAVLFGLGLPVYLGKATPTLHHTLFFVALGAQVVALAWLRRSVIRGERMLLELAQR